MGIKKQNLRKMEKRSLVRNRTQIGITCSSLTAKSPDAVSHGHMVNCSSAGSCIQLNHKVHEGSIVMIKATSFRITSPPEGFRTLALAEVKWSKRLEDGMIPGYTIGLRYLHN
jgi:PilZ domain